MLDVNELLRSTKRRFKSKSIPPGLQLRFNMQGVVFNNKNMTVDNQILIKINYESKLLIG